MSDEEKKAMAIQIYENIKQDNKKMLDDLIDEIEQRMRARDLSDEYLEEHGFSTREDIGIGEYSYGITMIPCESIYPYLLDLQSKNNLIEKQSKEIEELDKQNWIMRNVDKQYISKDKIKAKIEEQEKIINTGGIDFNTKSYARCKIEFGQSLLEKE